jgi:hypothetical protein
MCRQAPLKGHARCIRHCGPKAAREWRERQRQAFLAGRIASDVWLRAENRRAANRVRERWKKNPWHAGSTIDLGKHEDAFRVASGLASRIEHGDPLPPAVLDWLRWRYRRLQIDRRRDSEWTRVLRDELPRKWQAAGPDPQSAGQAIEQDAASPSFEWVVPESFGNFSKRRQLDRAKGAGGLRVTRNLRGRGRPRKHPKVEDTAEMVRFFFEYRETLAPMFLRCTSAEEQDAVVAALRNLIANPGNIAAHKRWLRVVSALDQQLNPS